MALRLREAAVNFQVSTNNEMHTVNVKQHQLKSNPPLLGNNEWLSLRPPTNSFLQRNQQAVELFVGTTCGSCYIFQCTLHNHITAGIPGHTVHRVTLYSIKVR